MTGALAFQTNGTTTQLAGQVFQVGSSAWINTLLGANSPQQLADRLFLAMARGTDGPADLSPLNMQSLNSLIWSAAPQMEWLAAPSQSPAQDTQVDFSADMLDQQATDVSRSYRRGRQGLCRPGER